MPIKSKIISFAVTKLGFDDCRFTDPQCEPYLEEYRAWIEDGRHGDMAYLQKHLPFKQNPSLLLKNARSAIIVIKNYKNTDAQKISGEMKIARYSVGKDYHLVMRERLEELSAFIKDLIPGAECYEGVDSRPLAERTLALKAGIGFKGKNTMVIKPGLGSYFFIGVILTNQTFESDQPLNWSCGECRLCVDQCPTQALEEISDGSVGRYWVDSSKCISYRTIEKKEALSETELNSTRGWMFGCDICQEVCPYNHGRGPLTDWKEFHASSGVGFDFLSRNSQTLRENQIPKDTALYRSRKRIVANVRGVNGMIARKG